MGVDTAPTFAKPVSSMSKVKCPLGRHGAASKRSPRRLSCASSSEMLCLGGTAVPAPEGGRTFVASADGALQTSSVLCSSSSCRCCCPSTSAVATASTAEDRATLSTPATDTEGGGRTDNTVPLALTTFTTQGSGGSFAMTCRAAAAAAVSGTGARLPFDEPCRT